MGLFCAGCNYPSDQGLVKIQNGLEVCPNCGSSTFVADGVAFGSDPTTLQFARDRDRASVREWEENL